MQFIYVPKYSSYNLHNYMTITFFETKFTCSILSNRIYLYSADACGCNWSLMSTKKKYNSIIECLVSENPFLNAFIIVQCSAFNCCVKPWSPRPTTPGYNYWKIKWYKPANRNPERFCQYLLNNKINYFF